MERWGKAKTVLGSQQIDVGGGWAQGEARADSHGKGENKEEKLYGFQDSGKIKWKVLHQ